ncbi:unnamed protein product [Meloidogyne enterolobii]|uniref:Uncharacterized protein n=1 Tax=Meloidogyne enterolobii TaxID=390850 RepID=A0ACB1ATV1_MELEN
MGNLLGEGGFSYIPSLIYRDFLLFKKYIHQVYSRMNSLCDETTKENDPGMLVPFFETLLLTFEFKSEIITELSKEFEKCSKSVGKERNIMETLIERFWKPQKYIKSILLIYSKEIPDYMKRMIAITGLAGQIMYNEDIAKRIKNYFESQNYEGNKEPDRNM